MTGLERDGFAWAPPVHAAALTALERVGALPRGGLRNALDRQEIADIASSHQLRGFASEALGHDAFCVRAIFFDKHARANWALGWHQDLTVALESRADVSDFGPWTTKAGVLHATAPTRLLERMIATRIHVDPCEHDNGPLRVLPGTHRLGRLDAAEIARLGSGSALECTARQGDVLLMRPLLLHASARSTGPTRRRVLHLEWACDELEASLRWRWHV